MFLFLIISFKLLVFLCVRKPIMNYTNTTRASIRVGGRSLEWLEYSSLSELVSKCNCSEQRFSICNIFYQSLIVKKLFYNENSLVVKELKFPIEKRWGMHFSRHWLANESYHGLGKEDNRPYS